MIQRLQHLKKKKKFLSGLSSNALFMVVFFYNLQHAFEKFHLFYKSWLDKPKSQGTGLS